MVLIQDMGYRQKAWGKGQRAWGKGHGAWGMGHCVDVRYAMRFALCPLHLKYLT
jgi:hypothetical protein